MVRFTAKSQVRKVILLPARGHAVTARDGMSVCFGASFRVTPGGRPNLGPFLTFLGVGYRCPPQGVPSQSIDNKGETNGM